MLCGNIDAVQFYSHFYCARRGPAILKLYWHSCNTACAGLANSTENCALLAAIKQHRYVAFWQRPVSRRHRQPPVAGIFRGELRLVIRGKDAAAPEQLRKRTLFGDD